jgi:glyoxylase-like metal-dependent hydrolase (beta-lactamase superfamily II)
MQIEHIAPDLFIAIGETYAANSTVFLNGDDALLIDGMASVADAEQLRALLDGKRVRFIISTHYFSDHMAALKLFPDADIIAHELYAHTFRTERFRTPKEEAHYVEPTIVIGDRMRLRFGRFTLDLFHNPGHTMSTIGVDVPEEDLLFTADTVVGNIVYLAYSAPSLMHSALDRLERRGRSRIIASHGGVQPASVIGNARRYLDRLPDVDTAELSDFERVFHERNLTAAR